MACVAVMLKPTLISSVSISDTVKIVFNFEKDAAVHLHTRFKRDARTCFRLCFLYLPEKKGIVAADPLDAVFAEKQRLIASWNTPYDISQDSRLLANYLVMLRNLPPSLDLPSSVEQRNWYSCQKVIPWYDPLLNSLERGSCVSVPLEQIIGKRRSLQQPCCTLL